MCKWGTDKEISLYMPTLVQRRTAVLVDACIAPLVQMLNDYKVMTTESCCGHGKTQGRIGLGDGQFILLPLKPVDPEDLDAFVRPEVNSG